MHTRLAPIGAIALVVMGLLGMVATVWWSAASPRDVPVGRSERAEGARDSDALFIEQMIPHHDDAIAMAELALTRAEHPEIRELAADIKRSQTEENARMRRWYREWYGTSVPEWDDSASPGGRPGMRGGGSMMRGPMMGGRMTDLAALEDAETFDKAFIEQMVPHHQMALMMSNMAGRATRRDEMRDLTESIIRTQSAEIASMQEWYAEWYGR